MSGWPRPSHRSPVRGSPSCAVFVLWLCCGCAVVALRMCCGCAVDVLWMCCGYAVLRMCGSGPRTPVAARCVGWITILCCGCAVVCCGCAVVVLWLRMFCECAVLLCCAACVWIGPPNPHRSPVRGLDLRRQHVVTHCQGVGTAPIFQGFSNQLKTGVTSRHFSLGRSHRRPQTGWRALVASWSRC